MDNSIVRQPRLLARASRALTLIEMMIVVAIIGLIAGLVIMQYSHSLDVSDVGATQMELKQIANAVDLYRLDKHAYPASGQATPALFGGAGNQYMNST